MSSHRTHIINCSERRVAVLMTEWTGERRFGFQSPSLLPTRREPGQLLFGAQFSHLRKEVGVDKLQRLFQVWPPLILQDAS